MSMRFLRDRVFWWLLTAALVCGASSIARDFAHEARVAAGGTTWTGWEVTFLALTVLSGVVLLPLLALRYRQRRDLERPTT